MSYYDDPDRLTSAQAADLLGIDRRTVYKWITEGRLPYPPRRSVYTAAAPAKRKRGPAKGTKYGPRKRV